MNPPKLPVNAFEFYPVPRLLSLDSTLCLLRLFASNLISVDKRGSVIPPSFVWFVSFVVPLLPVRCSRFPERSPFSDMKRVLEKLKVRLELVVLVIAALAGLAGIFGAFVFLPQRVDDLEKRVEAVATGTRQDHETLIRIEERVKAVQEKVDLLLQQKTALAAADY